MSFIYDDKKLLNSLIETGEQSINKKGQQQAPMTAEQRATFLLAKKMTQQLMRKMDPKSAPAASAPIGTESGNPVSFDRQNLETLGDFLKWASDNGVTWNGKRVAYVYPDPKQQGPQGYWKFRTYTIDRARDPYDRTAVEVPAYADKDSLIKVITYLRDSDEAKKEKVLEVMLGRLIAQTNQFLEKDEQIGPRTEKKPAEEFDANTMIDGFSDTTVNIRDPYAGIKEYLQSADPDKVVRVPLRWRDVSSKGNLINWMGAMKIVGGDNKPVTPTDPGVDPCGMIHLLYLRARYLSQYATDRLRPGLSKIEQAYLRQITTLGKEFDFNGQACAVTKPGYVGPEQPAQGGKISPQALQQLATLRPFKTQQIDFREIKLFLDKYVALQPGVKSAADTAKQAMDAANRRMGTTDLPVQIDNLTTAKIKGLTNQPLPLLNDLLSVISYAGRVYQDFYNEFKQILGAEAARPIEQQITSGGPQQQNLSTLLRVKERLMGEITR